MTQRVDGSQTGIFSIDPDISDDGRLVAFPSEDGQLVPGDTNGDLDVFVHDRSTGITRRVSVTTGGSQVNPGGSNWATLSGDGRYVAFGSNSGGLVPGDTNSAFSVDIFVRGPLG